ncbi:MAG: exonuclease VII small subunit [Candidatus Pelagibacter sp.]|nr:exonuclease VII small subunit [Candidatus Pelagibacter sp.]
MKDKNLPLDNNISSLEELTIEANSIIESLEKEKDLEHSIDTYQKLLKLNNIIEKKFHKDNKKINEETKSRINKILSKKNGK